MTAIDLFDLPLAPQLEGHPSWISLYRLSLDPTIAIITCITYVLVVRQWNAYNSTLKPSPSSSEFAKKSWSLFEILVVLHNVALCVFSGWVFARFAPITIKNFITRPTISEALCDRNHQWGRDGLWYFSWMFYLSKYYELIDTFILLAKGKKSSFLQTFHHTGSIITMWLLTASRVPPGWMFVLFNSAIHTVMYAYYTMTCFGWRPAWKPLLTFMQIMQFIAGDIIGFAYVKIPNCLVDHRKNVCLLPGVQWTAVNFRRFQEMSGYITLFFVLSLVILFTDFAKKTYYKTPIINSTGKNSKIDHNSTKKTARVKKA